MRIRNKRELLARGLQGLGVLALMRRLARRPCLLVVTYHRIGTPETNPFYDPVYSATPGTFASQVRFLRDHFVLITLDELMASAEAGFALRGPTALITFDDGYRDNFEQAFPILRDLGVPATFFLPTGLIDRPRLPWWDRIAYILKQTTRSTLSLDLPEPMTINLDETLRRDATWAVIRGFLASHDEDDPALMAHLEDRAGVPVDAEALARGLFLSWDDAREMAAAGMTFGSHTQSHPRLARLPETDQLRELVASRETLGRELGRRIAALAYPYGEAGSFTEATRRLAREAGYRLAFTASRGVNRPGRIDPLAIGRVGIGFADSDPLFRARVVCYAALGRSIF